MNSDLCFGLKTYFVLCFPCHSLTKRGRTSYAYFSDYSCFCCAYIGVFCLVVLIMQEYPRRGCFVAGMPKGEIVGIKDVGSPALHKTSSVKE